MVAAAGTEAASLTLAMRTGDDPGAVFDVLLARGQIRRHPDAAALQDAIAAAASFSDGDDRRVAVVVDTREQAAELNAALRERLVAAGRVDDIRVVVTAAGERLGAGNRITTRRNDRDLADFLLPGAIRGRSGEPPVDAKAPVKDGMEGVETRGIEPLTPALQNRPRGGLAEWALTENPS